MPKNFHSLNTMKATYENPVDRKSTTKKYWGIYIGTVDFNKDGTRTGKVSVNIPELNKNPNEKNLFDAMYTSPFYGASNTDLVREDDITLDENSLHSYGMWTPPPDVGNTVLVAFGDGLLSKPFIIGV